MEPNLLPSILGYRDAAPPVGRIIKQIGKYAVRLLDEDKTLDEHVRERRKESLLTLSWHRLRHTWAEQATLELYRKHGPGAWAILKEWGGWNSEESMKRYTEYAKRAISERAAREICRPSARKGNADDIRVESSGR